MGTRRHTDSEVPARLGRYGIRHARNGEDADALRPWPFKGKWHKVPRRKRLVRADDLPRFYAAVNETDERGRYVLGRAGRDLIVLLLFTGLRKGEAIGLRWADVDFAARIIRIPHERTKSDCPLDLPMNDVVHGLMVARRAFGQEGKFVFPGPGKSGHLQEPKGIFAAIAQRCGISISPHDLRRTFMTVAGRTPDISRYELKGLVNHSLGSDVTDEYVFMETEELQEAAQKVADRLKAYCKITPAPAENVRPLRPGG